MLNGRCFVSYNALCTTFKWRALLFVVLSFCLYGMWERILMDNNRFSFLRWSGVGVGGGGVGILIGKQRACKLLHKLYIYHLKLTKYGSGAWHQSLQLHCFERYCSFNMALTGQYICVRTVVHLTKERQKFQM